MKYPLHVTPTVERDFCHRPPQPRPSYGHFIGGICVLFGCFAWTVLLLHMEG